MNTSGKFPEVTGYIAEPERIALQHCVLETAHVEGEALEVGSLNGLSALLIASVLESRKTLICIEQGQVETLAKNLAPHRLGDRVAIQNEDFKKSELKPEVKLSFVFIDHDHSRDNNIAAFEKFWPRLSKGGILAFHDYKNQQFEEGSLAVEFLIRQNRLFTHVLAGTFIAFKKQ
jgi:predicted O-methyltransferase YrrM